MWTCTRRLVPSTNDSTDQLDPGTGCVTTLATSRMAWTETRWGRGAFRDKSPWKSDELFRCRFPSGTGFFDIRSNEKNYILLFVLVLGRSNFCKKDPTSVCFMSQMRRFRFVKEKSVVM